MDLLDTEEDRQDVTQRLEEFVTRENLIVANKNRVHYISAKAALKKQDGYLQSFRAFTQALEQFLTVECGVLQINRFADDIKDLIQIILVELQQAEDFLDGKIALSQAETQKILEQIGEASGRDVKVRILYDQILDLVVEETNKSWDKWAEKLGDRLVEKSAHWSSGHTGNFHHKEVVADFARQFNKDLSDELNDWIDNQFKENILRPYLNDLDEEIRKNLVAIQTSFNDIGTFKNSESSNWIFHRDQTSGVSDFDLGSLGMAALGVAVLVPAFILAGPILTVLGSLLGGGLLGDGVGGILGKQTAIKQQVLDRGCEQFVESLEKTFENIDEIIVAEFSKRIEQVDEVIGGAISMYENLLEQQEAVHQKNLEQREAEKEWIAQQRLELEQLRKNTESVIK